MRKKLLLVFALALLVPWAMRAQGPKVVVVGDTTSTTTNYTLPTNNFYNYSLTRMIIDADEIDGPMNITSLSFLYGSSNTMTHATNVSVYLMHTDRASFASSTDFEPIGDDAQLVYTGELNCTTGWNSFTLTTPFEYNGESNLMLIVLDEVSGYDGNGYKFTTSTCTGNKSLSLYSDSNVPSLSSPTSFTSKAVYAYRPVMKLNGTEITIAGCRKVKNLHVTATTSESITIDWIDTNNSSATYDLYMVGEGDTSILATGLSSTTYTVTDLEANTMYSFAVVANCGAGDESSMSFVSGRTACGAEPIPWFFEPDSLATTSSATELLCFEHMGGGYVNIATRTGFTGNTIRFYPDGSSEGNILVLPSFEEEINNLYLYLRMAPEGASSGSMDIGWYDPSDSSFVSVANYPVSNFNSTGSIVPAYVDALFTDAPAGARMALRHNVSSTAWYWFVDELRVTAVPTCVRADSCYITDLTSTSATLNLVGSGSGYMMLFAKSNSENYDTIEIYGNSYDFENLEQGTIYKGVIWTLCDGDTSMTFLSFSFTTECLNISEDLLPYVEDFEAYGTGATNPISPCWTKGTSNSTAYPYPYSTAAINGTRGLYFYGYNSTTSTPHYSWAALPQVDESLDMNTLMLTFNVKRYSTTSNYYTSLLCVGIADSTTGFNSAAAVDSLVTWIDTIDLFAEQGASIHAIEVNFAEYEGTGKYVVIYAPVPPLQGTSTYCYNYVYVDDVALRAIPNCFWPTAVSLQSVTTEEAELSWTPDPRTTEPNGWNIEYGPAGFTLGEGETDYASDTTIILTDLLPNTVYDFYVSADCGGDVSDPTSFTFRTECTALTTLPYTQDFESEATTSTTSHDFVPCWHLLNNATQYFGYPYVANSTTYNHTDGGSKGLYWSGSTTTGTYGDYYCIVLPAVDPEAYPMNTLQVRFWTRSSSTSYSPVFQVGVMTDPNDINSFQNVQTINVGGNTTWTEYTVPFGAYTGEGQYIAIKGTRPTSVWYAYMDDITIETMPHCPAIVDLEAATTVSSALLNWGWQEGYEAPANYVVTYDSIGGSNPVTINVSTNSIILTGLAAATEYKAYIQADCGDDGMGFMDSITFSTRNFGCAELDLTDVDSISIGNGTTTTYYFPVGNYYNYSYTQELVTADELDGPAIITGIDFQYGYSSPSTDKNNVTIYLANTNVTSLSNAFVPYSSAFVPVYTGNLNCTQGWNHFEFTTPFAYDGTNLLIAIHDNSGDFNGSAYVFTAHAATGKARYIQNDNTPYDITNPGAGTSYANRVNMKLHTAGCLSTATCAAPAVQVVGATASSVDLSWAPGTDETSWNVDYRLAGDSAWTNAAFGVTTNSYTFTGLLDGTDYDFRVSFYCTSDAADYAGTVTATTACARKTLPYTMDFEGVIGNVPNCWNYVMTGTSTYQTGAYLPSIVTQYAASGSSCLRLYGVGLFSLPEMDAPLDSLRIKFSDTITSASHGLIVGVMENGDFVPYDTLSLQTGVRNNIEVSLYNYHGTSRTIALKNYYTTSTTTYTSYHYIDDIEVSYIPACTHVEGLTASNITDSSVDLSWIPVGEENAWIIVYGDATQTVYDTFVTVTGLNPDADYVIGVRSLCSTVDTSEAAEITIRTACTPLAVPYFEDFESYMSGSAAAISSCWRKGTNSTTAYPYPYATNAVSGQRSLYFYAYRPSSATSTHYYSYAALPLFQDSVKNLSLSFDVRRYGTASNYYTTRLVVGVMDNPNDISTFFPMDTIDLWAEEASSIHSFEFLFNNYEGNGKYIAIYDEVPPLYGTGTYTYSYAYVDNIMVDLIPSCLRPTNVTVNNIGSNTATVHWTSTATDFEIEYGPHGFVQGTGTTVGSSYDSVDLTGLTVGVYYDVYVRALCSATDVSDWSFVTNFYTECGALSVPYTEDFESYGSGATSTIHPCWTKGTNHTTAYPYPYSTNAISGERSLYFYSYRPTSASSTSYYSYAALPEFDAPVNTLELMFDLRRYSTVSNYYTSLILVGVMTNPNDISTFVTIDSIDLQAAPALSVHQIDVTFQNYTDTGRYIALYAPVPPLYGTGTYSYNYCYVDNIFVSTASPCPRPFDLQAYDGTANSVTLEWTDTIGSGSWVVSYAVGNDTNWTDVNVNSNPYTLTGLTANTTYRYRVAAYCADGNVSDWSRDVLTFTTSQVPATVPYTYDFENAAEWNNWQTASNNSVNWYRGNIVPGNTTNVMYLSADNGTTHSWNMNTITNAVAYRDIDFGTDVHSFQVDFDAYVGGTTSANYDGIAVVVADPATSVVCSSTGLNTPWGHINSVGYGTVRHDTTWGHHTIYLDGISGVKRVAFYWFNQSTGATYAYEDNPPAIDNISITLQECERPSDLVTLGTTTTTAQLTWSGNATDQYVVAYRVQGTSASTNMYQMVTGLSATLTGLTPATKYYWWVSHICTLTATDTVASGYAGAGTFVTPCNYTELPYTEDFESVTGHAYNVLGEMPSCWEIYTDGAAEKYAPHVVDSGTYAHYPHSGTHCLGMVSGNGTDYGPTKIAVMPPFNAPVNSLKMKFWYRMESATSGTLTVGYVTDLSDLNGSYTPIHTVTSVTTVSQDSVSFEGVPANALQIAFRWSHNSTWYTVSVDDIEVWSEVTTCSAPEVGVDTVSETTATLSWTGLAANYEVAAVAGEWVEPASGAPVSGFTHILTGLTAGTQYSIGVRAVCAEDFYSDWVVVTATTAVHPCYAPTALNVSDITVSGATLSWQPGEAGQTNFEVNVTGLNFDETYTATGTSYTVTGLNANGEYTATVRAVCDENYYSDWSTPATFTTVACVRPSQPAASDITANGATITWPATSNSNGSYVLEYGIAGFNYGSGTSVTVNGTSYTITGLDAEYVCDVYVRSVCDEGVYSDWSPVCTFTTASGAGTYYTVTVTVNDPAMGHVDGAPTQPVEAGTVVTLTAVANDGYHFVNWNDGQTTASITFAVNGNMTVTANFAQNSGIDDVDATAVSVYPNPASSDVTVKVGQPSEVMVIDMQGRTVIPATAVNSTLLIPHSSLPAGTYFLRITGEQTTLVRKLIVQ